MSISKTIVAMNREEVTVLLTSFGCNIETINKLSNLNPVEIGDLFMQDLPFGFCDYDEVRKLIIGENNEFTTTDLNSLANQSEQVTINDQYLSTR